MNIQENILSGVFLLAIAVLAQGYESGKHHSLTILDMDDFKVQTLEMEFASLP